MSGDLKVKNEGYFSRVGLVWSTNQAEEISSPRQRKCARWGRGQSKKDGDIESQRGTESGRGKFREADAERARARCKGGGGGKERQGKDAWGHTGDQDGGRDVQAAGLRGKRAEV